jgi:hypothetical protein
MNDAINDLIRATAEEREETDIHTTDISTFVNDNFIFYVPPPPAPLPNATTQMLGMDLSIELVIITSRI